MFQFMAKVVPHSFQTKISPSETTVFVYVWIYFNLIPNTILLSLLVATFLFSKSAPRHPTLINVCMTWILSGIFACLLFYAGKEVGPHPSKRLCIVQASLLYGIAPMWAVAVLMLIYHMLVALDGDPIKAKLRKTKLCIMLAAPYITQLAFALAALVISLQYPHKVSRNHRRLYCSLRSSPLASAVSIFTFSIAIVITSLEGLLAITLYRIWCGGRRAGISSGVDVQFILRVLAFGVYIFFGVVVCLVGFVNQFTIVPDIYAATVGTVLLLIFGTQADVFRAWCFWRPKRRWLPVIDGPVNVVSSHRDPAKYEFDVKEKIDEEQIMPAITFPEMVLPRNERPSEP